MHTCCGAEGAGVRARRVFSLQAWLVKLGRLDLLLLLLPRHQGPLLVVPKAQHGSFAGSRLDLGSRRRCLLLLIIFLKG